MAVSSFLVTKPYGVTDQPDFLNGAIKLEYDKSPEELLEVLLAVEQEMGRVRLRHWGERIIDLDLLLFGQEVIETKNLVVPHKDMVAKETRVCTVPFTPLEERMLQEKPYLMEGLGKLRELLGPEKFKKYISTVHNINKNDTAILLVAGSELHRTNLERECIGAIMKQISLWLILPQICVLPRLRLLPK